MGGYELLGALDWQPDVLAGLLAPLLGPWSSTGSGDGFGALLPAADGSAVRQGFLVAWSLALALSGMNDKGALQSEPPPHHPDLTSSNPPGGGGETQSTPSTPVTGRRPARELLLLAGMNDHTNGGTSSADDHWPDDEPEEGLQQGVGRNSTSGAAVKSSGQGAAPHPDHHTQQLQPSQLGLPQLAAVVETCQLMACVADISSAYLGPAVDLLTSAGSSGSKHTSASSSAAATGTAPARLAAVLQRLLDLDWTAVCQSHVVCLLQALYSAARGGVGGTGQQPAAPPPSTGAAARTSGSGRLRRAPEAAAAAAAAVVASSPADSRAAEVPLLQWLCALLCAPRLHPPQAVRAAVRAAASPAARAASGRADSTHSGKRAAARPRRPPGADRATQGAERWRAVERATCGTAEAAGGRQQQRRWWRSSRQRWWWWWWRRQRWAEPCTWNTGRLVDTCGHHRHRHHHQLTHLECRPDSEAQEHTPLKQHSSTHKELGTFSLQTITTHSR